MPKHSKTKRRFCKACSANSSSKKLRCIVEIKANIVQKTKNKRRKCHRKRKSIERPKRLIIKSETLHSDRILPKCFRSRCKTSSKTLNHKEKRKGQKDVTLSPISDKSLELYCDEAISDSYLGPEEKLDILIKRTKERERRMLLSQIQTKEWGDADEMIQYEDISTEDPFTGDFKTESTNNDADTVFSTDMDVSIHSLTTVVLNPSYSEVYSPKQSPQSFISQSDDEYKFWPTFEDGKQPYDFMPTNLKKRPYSGPISISNEQEVNSVIVKQEIFETVVIDDDNKVIVVKKEKD